ncbi:PREDICTED: uncharacterized protein LOC105451581 [Wasmannia auropunctata]|uniref:uncharacterized protein LOC105451581 n=1 Tax=Wasmannia auropunctata TaxID=64793 RepID=UPI0005EFDD93|nr:PREDICTED: uncharacterized protein LOC105451581 [Wasmannia auropunctata]
MVSNNMSTKTGDSEDSLKSSNEYRYVMIFKSKFERELFPNNFNMWTVRQQYMWINDNIAAFFPNVPKSLLDLIPATFRPGDCQSSMQIPEWLDMDKYRRGQKFVRENFAALFIAKILGVIHVYSFNEFIKPIIISKGSHTPYLGFKRYTSTIQRFVSWYEGEPWIEGTPAYKDMQFTRKMHLMIQSKLGKLDHEQIDNESKIAEPWCPDRELFLQDFAAACPLEKDGQFPTIVLDKSPYKPKGVNNADMQRTRDFYQYWLLPNLRKVTPEWEHMTRCFIESLNYYSLLYMPYKTMALLAMDTLGVSMPHLYASMSYAEWIAYKSWRFLLRYVLKFSSFRVIFNKVVHKIFDEAKNISPEKEAEFQKKSEKQLSNFSTVHY